MSGNAWEWCSTLWGEKVYPFQVTNEWTETYLSKGGRRVLRGGSWDYARVFARCSIRFRDAPDRSDISSGFRVVSPI
jgi:iron(II)-dependent oxidoreductase